MTITMTLPNFPLINQLNAPTDDGQPDENARENCVAASVAAVLTYRTGKRFEPDEVKDAVYGQGYVGVQSAAQYVQYCAKQGVALYAHNGSQANLIATIRAELAAGTPVLVTMPSQWRSAPADPVRPQGYTHVGVMCGYGPDALRCMNPWGGFWQDQPDTWWQARLCFGQVWPLRSVVQKESGGTANMSNNTAGLGSGFVAYVQQHNVTAAGVSGGEHIYVRGGPHGNESFASFANGLILYYSDKDLADASKPGRVRDDLGGYVAAALWNALAAAQQQVATLTSANGKLTAEFATANQALAQATQRLNESAAAASASAPTAPTLDTATPEQLISAFVRSLARTWAAQQATQPIAAAVTAAEAPAK